MKSIKIYFDKIFHNGGYAETFNGEKILYNLNLIAPDDYEAYANALTDSRNTGATIIFSGGRYIGLATASLDANEKCMKIYDFKDMEQGPKMVFADDPDLLAKMMAVFYKCRKTYKKDINKFMAIEGNLPSNEES